MGSGRIALPLLFVAIAVAACTTGDDDPAGVTIDQPIGAPEPGSNPDEQSSGDASAAVDAGPSVVKTASVEVDVFQDELNSAAQEVVDLATSSNVGGFLVSSVVDLNEGYGSGSVVVKVPAPRFEQVVGDLETIGEVTRQQLEGQDLSAEFLDTHASVQRARSRTATLLSRLERSKDPGVKFKLRADLLASREELRRLQQNESYITGQTAYSLINVALAGKQPPAAPEKPAFERALATAKAIVLAIASGAVLAAGVIVPIGLLLLILYLLGAPIFRRLRPRLEGRVQDV